MAFTLIAALLSLVLFALLLVFQELGRRWGMRSAKEGGGGREGLGGVEGAVYGLLGLLVAFSFSGAGSRFEARHDMVVKEANAIGTAYLRLDLLSEGSRTTLREKFRRYLDARLSAYGKLPDLDAMDAELARANALQGEIWTEAIPAAQAAGPSATLMLVPALNDMFDITTTRLAALRFHPPVFLFLTLVILTLASALLVGYAMAGSGTRSRLHMMAYAGVLALTIYVIVDLEFPRVGLIRVTAVDRLLVDLREGMK